MILYPEIVYYMNLFNNIVESTIKYKYLEEGTLIIILSILN